MVPEMKNPIKNEQRMAHLGFSNPVIQNPSSSSLAQKPKIKNWIIQGKVFWYQYSMLTVAANNERRELGKRRKTITWALEIQISNLPPLVLFRDCSFEHGPVQQRVELWSLFWAECPDDPRWCDSGNPPTFITATNFFLPFKLLLPASLCPSN